MAASASKASQPPLDLPPVYRLVTLRESKDAFVHACQIADREGAGTLVWVRRFDVVEFAVVLEPEAPLAQARRAFFAGMSALGDALGAVAPPERPVTFGWPDVVQLNEGRLGGGRLGWPEQCPDDQVPDWLVFAAMLLAAPVGMADPGATPTATWLEEEGFEGGCGPALIESFARHLMVTFDMWSERGFAPVGQRYLDRLPREAPEQRRAIDHNGDLLVRHAGGMDRRPLLEALRQPSWLDPASGLPRL
jgi:hypothetical protein